MTMRRSNRQFTYSDDNLNIPHFLGQVPDHRSFTDYEEYIAQLTESRPPATLEINQEVIGHRLFARLQTFLYKQEYALSFHLDPVWHCAKTALGEALSKQFATHGADPYPFQLRLRTETRLADPLARHNEILKFSSTKYQSITNDTVYKRRMQELFNLTQSELSKFSDPIILWHVTFNLDVYEQMYETGTVPIE